MKDLDSGAILILAFIALCGLGLVCTAAVEVAKELRKEPARAVPIATPAE